MDGECSHGSATRYSGQAIVFLICAGFMAGCGSSPGGSGGGGGGRGPTGLGLPAAHTQAWVTQVQNQTLPPASEEALLVDGWGLNTVVAAAADAQGNLIAAGYTGDQFPGATNPSWNRNAFVAKFTPQGKLAWTLQFTPSSDPAENDVDAASAVATDSAGNIYAGGTTFGAFPGFSNPGNRECLFLAKIDPAGKLLSVQQYDAIGSRIHYGFGMTVTSIGRVAFAWIEAATQPGTGDFTEIATIDPAKDEIVGLRNYFGVNDLAALTSDTEGNLILTGTSQGGFPGSISGAWGSFVAKISLDTGAVMWQQAIQGDSGATYVDLRSVAVDGNGDVVAGGASSDAMAFCQGLCLPPLPGNIYLVKLNGATGDTLWTKDIGDGAGSGVTGVATDSNNNVLAVGYTSDQMASGFTPATQNLFALKLDSGGSVTWAQQFGAGAWVAGADPLYGMPAAVDSSGNLLVAAETQRAFAGYINPTNVSQIFAARFGP